MSELGLSDPQLWEPSVAFHLHPTHRSVSASSSISLPSKADKLTASVYQSMYKYAAKIESPSILSHCCQLIRLRYGRRWVISWTHRLPTLSSGMRCVVNDLLLHSSTGVVQGCDHVTGIEVTGESLVAELTWLW